jgi:hypothetical protein
MATKTSRKPTRERAAKVVASSKARPAKRAAKTVSKKRTPASRKAPRQRTPPAQGMDLPLASESSDTREQANETFLYSAADIEDAPEFNALSRAMGTMTWGTWDSDERPFEERLQDFLFAYPPTGPVRHIAGRLRKQPDGSFAPGNVEGRLQRFLADNWEHGSIHELLSRFGLRMRNRPPVQNHVVHLDPLRDVAKRRNVRLRVLHGGVDVEPINMDAAKAEYLDRQEKKQAAVDVRAARARMQEELAESHRNKNE